MSTTTKQKKTNRAGKTSEQVKPRLESSPSSIDYFRGLIDPISSPTTGFKRTENVYRSKPPGYHAPTFTSLNRNGDVSNILKIQPQVSPSPPHVNLGQSLNSGRPRLKAKADPTNPYSFNSMNLLNAMESPLPQRKATKSKRPKAASTSSKLERSGQNTPPNSIDSELRSLRKALLSKQTELKPKVKSKTRTKLIKLSEAPASTEIIDSPGSTTGVLQPQKSIKKRPRPKTPDDAPISPAKLNDEDITPTATGSSSYIGSPEVNGNDEFDFSSNASPKHDYPVLNEVDVTEPSNATLSEQLQHALADLMKKNQLNSQIMQETELLDGQTSVGPDTTEDDNYDHYTEQGQGIQLEKPKESSKDVLKQEQQTTKPLLKVKSSRVIKGKLSKNFEGVNAKKKPSGLAKASNTPQKTYVEIGSDPHIELDLIIGNRFTSDLPSRKNEPAEPSPSISTQTCFTGQDGESQAGRSLTVLHHPESTDQAAGPDEILVEIEDDDNSTKECIPFSPPVEMTPLQPTIADIFSDTIIETTLGDTANTLKITSDPQDDNITNNNLISFPSNTSTKLNAKEIEEFDLFEAECGDKSCKYEVKQKVSQGGGSLAFLDGQISTVGCSISVLSMETKGISSVVTSFKGDNAQTMNSLDEIKCYQLGTSPLVDIHIDQGQSIHSHSSVGNSGISKALSLTSCNMPVLRKLPKPLASVTCNQERTSMTSLISIPATTSTQTIDEKNAMCQVGHSLTSLVTGSEVVTSKAMTPFDINGDLICENDFMDSDSLLNMPETIVQSINDLDLGTNIEKISETISTTFKAVTEIIIELVQTDDKSDGVPAKQTEPLAIAPPPRPSLKEPLEAPAGVADDGDEEDDDEYTTSAFNLDSRFPSLQQCAPLDPTLSETSFV